MKNIIGLLVSFCLGITSLWAQPMVNLGADTTVCASLWILDAGNLGATHLWSTGAKTSDINVTNSGIYWVDVTNGTGTTRDSIILTLTPRPILSSLPIDTNFCTGTQVLSVQASTGVVQWLDGAGQVLSLGNTINYNVIDTALLQYRATSFTPLSGTIGLPLSSRPTGYAATSPRGIVFNVYEHLRLNSVQLDIDNGPFTAQIEIEDNLGNSLYTIPVSLPSAGQHMVNLNVDLPVGNGYTMQLKNISGGHARYNHPVSPAKWATYGNNAILEMVEGVQFSTVYAYFYDWQISTLDPNNCSSNLDSILINSLEKPIVSLGNDTTLCGGRLLLNAFNVGATYVWNTGATNSSVFATTSGLYSVTATQGGQCSSVDSIEVVVIPQPVLTSRPADQDACEGTILLSAQASAGVIQWMDSTGQALGAGDSLSYNLTDTTKIWYQAGYFTPLSGSIGLPLSSRPTGYAATSPRGIVFNVYEHLRLNSIRLDIDNGPFTAQIEIEDNLGNSLYTIPVSLPSAGQHRVNLNVDLPVGNGYTIQLTNIGGGRARYNHPVSPAKWATYGNNAILEMVEGAQFTTVYAYFYDWQISTLDVRGCSSSLDSVLLNSLETPVIDFGEDTTLCSQSLLLNPSVPNATYVWNTGGGSSSIFVTMSGTYAVTVTQGGQCSDTDSINVTVLQEPNLTRVPVDQDACQGDLLLKAQADGGTVQWLDSTGQVIALGNNFNYTVVDSTKLLLKAGYYIALDDTLGLSLNSTPTGYSDAEPRGVVFNANAFVKINSVHLDIDAGPFTADIELEDATGQILASVPVSLPSAGQYKVVLDIDVPKGNDYQLILRNISGGRARYNNPVTPANWATYGNQYIELTRGILYDRVYAYFYDWQIAILDVACTSDLDSFIINSLERPIVSIGNDTILCSDSLLLDATINNGVYTWNTGVNSAQIFVNTTGTYAVTVTQNNVCFVTDSIEVRVIEQPQFIQRPADQNACRGLVNLVAIADQGTVQWFDSAGMVVAVGDTFVYDLQDTAIVRYQSGYYNIFNDTLGLSLNSSATGYSDAEPRGVIFNANAFIKINSVHLDIDAGPFTADIELEDSTGKILASVPVSLPSAGQYKVVLDIDVPKGNDYQLILRNISGGRARYNNPVTPANWATYGNQYIELTRGILYDRVYAYFYDWQIAVLSDYCSSTKDSVLLSLLPTPEITLPVDTVVCNDSIVLDIAYPNATYNWAFNGSTSSQVTITQEGKYIVTTSINTCSVSDSIDIFLAPTPRPILLSTDTTTCVGLIERRGVGADILKWYNRPTGGQQLGQGDVFEYLAQSSDTIWLAGQNFANKRYTQGLVDTFVASRSLFFFPDNVRGLLFDAKENIMLEEVTLYLGRTPLIGRIALWDSTDQMVNSQDVVLTNRGANVATLNFFIPKGENYKLMLTHYNTVDVLVETPFTNYPIIGDQVDIKAGFPFAINYHYFYNWQVKTLGCESPRLPSVVTVLPTPNVDFPIDTVVCGDSLVLDVSNIGATSYNWSTGATTSRIVTDSSVKISLMASIGICSDEDSTSIFVVEPPSIINPPNDTVLCGGNATFRVSGNAAYYAWYDSLSSGMPFAFGDSVRINLTDSLTFWVEGVGFLPQSEPLGEQVNLNSPTATWIEPQNSFYPVRGMSFKVEAPILLNTVDVYVDTFTTAEVTLYKSGFPYWTRSINLPSNGRNVVSIDTLLESGVYRIELSNKSAGRILVEAPYSNRRLQQLNTSNITFLGSTPFLKQYFYFYNWKISTPSCATSRLPVRIDVPQTPVLTLVADTATCTASSLVLDPLIGNNNSNYNYMWSNSASSDTLTVNSSGYYTVTVTNNGQCSSVRSTFVQFLTTPQGTNLPNQTICAPETLDLLAPVNDGILVWYDSSTLNNISYLSAPYRQYVKDTSTFWLGVAPKATTRIGAQSYVNPNEGGAYFNFIIANTFDVLEHSILDSVAIYVQNAPANVTWVVMDSLGNTLYSGAQTINRAREKVFLPIHALLAPSKKYQLSFKSISVPFLVEREPVKTPTSSANIARLTGTTFVGVDYTSFFDWHFSYAFPDCHAPTDTFAVRVQLPIGLPDSIHSCDSAVVDVTNLLSASYQWSTGATTGQTTLYQGGLYTVTISDGAACTVVDTVVLEQPQAVGLPTTGEICGNQLGTNYLGSNATYIWNTGGTTPLITVPGPNIYSVTVTTVEGCTMVDSAYIAQLIPEPNPLLGGNRTLCFNDILDAGSGGLGMTYLWSTGDTTQRIAVNQSDLYSVTVTHPLGCTGTDAAFITLGNLPNASFTVSKSGNTVLFNNTSTNIDLNTRFVWHVGDGRQYNIPNPFHSYRDTGCYDILLVVYGSCGNDSVMQTTGIGRPDSSCTVSINHLAGADLFQVVPNPTDGTFEVWLERPLQEQAALMLYNSQGMLVTTRVLQQIGEQHHRIRLDDLPTGLYFLHLRSGDYQEVQRLLIQRP